MPALPPIPNVMRVEYFFHLSEDLRAKVRTFWQYFTGPPTPAEVAAAAAGIRAAFATDLAGLLSAAYSLVEVIVTDMNSSTGAVGTDSTIVPGTRAGANLPAEVCLLQSNHIGRRFRGGHCRVYLPFGVSPDLQDEQTWQAAFVTTATSDIATFHGHAQAQLTFGATSAQRVAVSQYQGFTVHTGVTGRARNVSTPRPVPLIDLITGSTVQVGVASQRKRLLRLA